MRTVKPQRVGVLHRTVENGGRFYFVPSALVAFRFDQPDVPVHEAAMWKAVGSAIGVAGTFDEAMRKERCEVLVLGSAMAVGGKETIGCEVRLQFGPPEAPLIDKRLTVVGDRSWTTTGMTDPVPFAEMPVGWERAFGGEGHDENPLGRGLSPRGGAHPLPNVEDPRRPIRSEGDQPPPAGFGPRDIRAASRQALAGTYDETWLKDHYPGFPPDFDWTFFNAAPRDQWLEDDLTGGEPFAVEGMHVQGRVEGRCPRLRPRAFVTEQGRPDLDEIPLRLDTLWLLPNHRLGVAVYRGLRRVREDDASDLEHLLLACEDPGEERPRAHYAACLQRRTVGDMRGLEALRDDELLPPLPPGADPMGMEDLAGPLQDILGEENLLAVHQTGKAQRHLDEERQRILEVDGELPEGFPERVPQASAPPSPDEIRAHLERAEAEAKEAQEKAEAEREAFEAQLREQLSAQGEDYDELLLEARRRQAGPPSFDPDAEYERLVQMQQLSENAGVPLPEVERQLADPTLRERLTAMRDQLVAAYRENAHFMVAAVAMRPDEAAQARREVLRARDEGSSLAHRDFTGADLHGLDLSGMDLSGAFLEAANLRGTVLTDANLTEAVLARTDLTDAVLRGATCTGANFGGATLHATDLTEADLTGAQLSRAVLTEVVLEGACIDGTTWIESAIHGGRFRKLKGERLVALGLDLSDVDLREAELADLVLLQGKLTRANLWHANLERACLVEVDAREANFDEVRGTSLRVVHGSQLDRCTFRRAQLRGATFRGASLTSSDFTEAELSEADLSEARLEDAKLERVIGHRLMAMRAHFEGASLYGSDLREAVLGKAYLASTDLSRSNLFRADLFRIHTNGSTKLDGAQMQQIRFKEHPGG